MKLRAVGRSQLTWYEEYLESEHWQMTRADALARAQQRCQICNGQNGLQVHHRNYRHLGNECPEDLTVLCRGCHQLFHEQGRLVPIPHIVEDEVRVCILGAAIVSSTSRFIVRYERENGSADMAELRYVVHANGTPWGGSRYREFWEGMLGRSLRRGEVPDPAILKGKEAIFTFRTYMSGYATQMLVAARLTNE